MKNIMLFLSLIVLVGAVGCSSNKSASPDVATDEGKTIGQQLDEAGASLKDCRKNCDEAATPQMKQQCLQACAYAKQIHGMAKEATKGVADKTQGQIAEDFQKRVYGNMNEQQLKKIKALQAQGKIPQNLTAGAEGAQAGAEPNPDDLPEQPEAAGVPH